MHTDTRTPISQIGKFGLIERISGAFTHKESATLQGVGADGAAMLYQEPVTVSAQALFLEGVHFDLSYTPLQHLGYKVVVRALGQLMAMNAQPRHLLITAGLSKRFFVEDVDRLFGGVEAACNEYQVEVAGLDVESSYTGLTISVTAVGEAESAALTIRRGGQPTDLLCITGNLGAAYMGLQLLEREKALFNSAPKTRPQLQGKEYILQRHLRPTLRKELFTILQRESLIPTSMCFLVHGLAQGVLAMANASGCGAKIYVEKIPIASKTFEMAQELNFDALVCALNGGDDYEFLIGMPLAVYETVAKELPVDIIGHLCDASQGSLLVTPEGNSLPLSAPGWGE
ncbi:MAG: thiamine-phosphate kinase [Bacteroidales bacterium]|nr:thiamine-phosphate kinase [Bacteroidales bacterium]